MDELMQLLNFKFTIPGRAVARDLYCFMCFTGLRVSDISSLKREHIKDGQIFKTIVKTRQTIVIMTPFFCFKNNKVLQLFIIQTNVGIL